MKSFVIREINDDVWRKAKAKAALEGTTMKDKVVELITEWAKTPVKQRRAS